MFDLEGAIPDPVHTCWITVMTLVMLAAIQQSYQVATANPVDALRGA